jgi:hypothetical protein
MDRGGSGLVYPWAGDDGIDSPKFYVTRSKLLTEYLMSYPRLSVSNITIATCSLFSLPMCLKLLCVSMTALWNRTQCTKIRAVGNVLVDYGVNSLHRTSNYR